MGYIAYQTACVFDNCVTAVVFGDHLTFFSVVKNTHPAWRRFTAVHHSTNVVIEGTAVQIPQTRQGYVENLHYLWCKPKLGLV